MKTNRLALGIGCLILAGTLPGIRPAKAQAQEPAGVPANHAVISSVAITQAPERASVRVEGEGRLDVHAARMQSPDRLVLDFAGARLAVEKTSIPGVSAPVLGIRMGQFRPGVARVVVDLTMAAPYQIKRDGEAVVIYFEGAAAAPDADVTSAHVTSTQAEKVHPEFHYAESAPRATARAAKLTRVSAPRFALPAELTRSSAALAMFDGANAPAKPDGQQAGQQAAQQANTAAATMAASTGTPSTAAQGKYTGEPISVNLKDVDLRDFFRLIHEISGLNVILDPAVKGTLTIVLDEVPWDQALDIVLQNNGLDKQLSGNVLRIATRDTLKKEAETTRDLEKAQAEAVAPVTVTRVLSYSKSATLKDTLKKFLSSRGDILSDDRSNQLIIRDIPSVIPVIDNLIRQLDRKSQQVEIEARVVSATRTFAQDIGTQLGFAGSAVGGRSLFSGASAVGGSGVTTGPGIPPSPVTVTAAPGGIPLLSNLGAAAPTSGFGFSHRSPNFALDFFITAAEAKGVGKLLSKPRVVTQNNEKAVVKQGTKIPVQTTINNTISIQFIDAVLKLEVTPQVTAEGTVFMDVLVENTQIDNGIARVQGVPALNTQSAETKVLVGDGQTFVVGGIIISQQRVDITEVPLVGSLPLIGHLFKRTNVSVTSQELLFFLTPRIIPG
ncbi:MAG TPA: type IV pilus secretin PilQ [Candidatus Dormibacteraeota bacterium]|nr:type IV pilus secretin PilQ [Candidatus Dormibacteraeota bacterium]